MQDADWQGEVERICARRQSVPGRMDMICTMDGSNKENKEKEERKRASDSAKIKPAASVFDRQLCSYARIMQKTDAL